MHLLVKVCIIAEIGSLEEVLDLGLSLSTYVSSW